MQERRPAAVALALVMPHSVAPRRRSSLLSSMASPRTPLSCGSPPSSFLFQATGNRKSGDSWSSWNSSNGDTLDEEREWNAEEIMLLSRTLEALPSHLITPFNGPVPPSNLLDKLAKGVSEAKSSSEWPHSLRATRVKLIELARSRAKDGSPREHRKPASETDSSGMDDSDVLKPTTNTGPKRPVYRQSSMDFVQTEKLDIKNNHNIARLSNRLQRSDRIIANPAYHPYSRPLSSSKSRNFSAPHGCDSPSHASRAGSLRRTLSTASGSSDNLFTSLDAAVIDHRASGLRRSDSFMSYTSRVSHPLKRAPSFSESSDSTRMSGIEADADKHQSTDDEGKPRTRKAKKAKIKAASPSPKRASSGSSLSSDTKKEESDSSSNSLSSSSTKVSLASDKPLPPLLTGKRPVVAKPRARANIQRNPSILGGLLPPPPPCQTQDLLPMQHPTTNASSVASARSTSPLQSRTLRRVKRTDFRSTDPSLGRRISFGSLSSAREEENAGLCPAPSVVQQGSGSGLGSAFQLL